ncbi:MAG: CoA transferase, partial [Alphaproteobacteria bacterium]|nr:CoA transferase [Alphaproteobacteria bacterium]
LTTKGLKHWTQVLDAAGVPAGPINDIEQALAFPQAAARNMVIEVDDPVAGRMKLAGNPVKLSTLPERATRPPAPELDADRAAVLKELGL